MKLIRLLTAAAMPALVALQVACSPPDTTEVVEPSAATVPATTPPVPTRPDTTSPQPDRTTSEPTHAAPPQVVPAALVGSWKSAGEGSAELTYRFGADGTYRFMGLIMQQRPSGMFSFEIDAAGTAQATRSQIILRPESGTRTLKDPDSRNGGWERPVSKDQQLLGWRMSGGRLLLTDAEGVTVTYRRQR